MKTTKFIKAPNNLKYLLKFKTRVIYLCTLILCITAIYLVLNYSTKYLYLNHFESLSKNISTNTIAVIRHMVITEDYLSIKSIFTQISENPLIDCIAVYSAGDVKLVGQINNDTTDTNNIEETFTPIYWQDKIIGYLHLVLNQKYLLTEIQFTINVIFAAILLVLIATFFILWLYYNTTDKHLLQAKTIFCQQFNKQTNPKHTTVVQLYSLATDIAYQQTNYNDIIVASLVVKIKDKFIQNKLNKNNLTELFRKINIIAINCAKYCLDNARVINNNKHTTSIIINSNEVTKNIVFCALVIQFLIKEIYNDEILPIGIGICLLPDNIDNKNKLQYLFNNSSKLADLSCKNYICTSQLTINNISIAGINYMQHTSVGGAFLFKATEELKHNIKQHAKNIKKFILQYS